MSATATARKKKSIRARLKQNGERRMRHDAKAEELAEETEQLLAEAKREGVPITEAAELTHLHRTTLYRVYLPDNGS